jgi:hypothetical protein
MSLPARRNTSLRAFAAPLVVVVACTLGAGCSKKTSDAVGKAANSAASDVKTSASKFSAVVAARAFQADLKVRVAKNKHDPKSVTVLHASAHDISKTSGVTVSGISDTNKDHKDDDGKVQFEVSNQFACLTINSASDMTVAEGKC